MDFKFIHAADLHIDSPMRGLSNYDGAPAERLRSATRQALTALVDLAIAEQVAFVLYVGDIFDGDWADFHTGQFFREQNVRLVRAAIRVFIVKGNHDAESQITKVLPKVEGVHVFDHKRCETQEIAELKVALHGQSFKQRAVTDDLAQDYPAAQTGWFNIGLLHTCLTPETAGTHLPYAPTSVATLASKGYDYFALGHVHQRQVVRETAPRIVFPGNLQGRHANETGSKGCELVTVRDGQIEAEHIALDRVRWHRLGIDATGLADVDALAAACSAQLRTLLEDMPEPLHAVRVSVAGQSELARLEAAQRGTVEAAVRAAAEDLQGLDVWIEKVEADLSAPIDRAALEGRDDALSEVVRLVNELAGDDDSVLVWVRGELQDLKELPSDLASQAPGNLDAAALRELLADAEATVLAKMPASVAKPAGQGRAPT
ncbi:DNA repair exonuclease [Ramlibacter sp. WS9]|uniref:metallophosphoesterase family protein n=1 Tax=Ramlibacter sp. WS9 TaxID=1882741 RepID=UPI001143B33D|nr:DNA repair exonuclease [Ramlibacter sp. WS9]ROZ78009.1 DNA repair exonuclease [Ramlibacter sp. WS9]